MGGLWSNENLDRLVKVLWNLCTFYKFTIYFSIFAKGLYNLSLLKAIYQYLRVHWAGLDEGEFCD